MDLRLELVTPENLPVLRNLYTLYRYDLLRYLSALPGCDLDEHGTFGEAHVDGWSKNPGTLEAVLFQRAGQLAGFATVARAPYAHPSVDHRLQDFFVLNKFARRGLGRLAAEAVLRRSPGTWEVLWAEENAPAIAFWRRVIPELAPGAHEPWVAEDTPYNEGGPGLRLEISPSD